MTMAFATVGFATALLGLASRRTLEPAWADPLMPFDKWTAYGLAFVHIAVELPLMQQIVGTVGLTFERWAVVALLALPAPAVVESEKAIRRRR